MKNILQRGKGFRNRVGVATYITPPTFLAQADVLTQKKNIYENGVFCFVGWQYHLSLKRNILAVIHPSFFKKTKYSAPSK